LHQNLQFGLEVELDGRSVVRVEAEYLRGKEVLCAELQGVIPCKLARFVVKLMPIFINFYDGNSVFQHEWNIWVGSFRFRIVTFPINLLLARCTSKKGALIKSNTVTKEMAHSL
jgi:hypothetical protein